MKNIPAADVSSEAIALLRRLRDERGMSAQMLADRMAELGYPVSRSTIANAESGRRSEIPLDYFLVAALALDTTPPQLLAQLWVCPECEGAPGAGFTCNACSAAGPELCLTCRSEPPSGFTCNACGQAGGAR